MLPTLDQMNREQSPARKAAPATHRWLRRWAGLGWGCWVGSIGLLWTEHRLGVLHPWSLLFLLLLVVTLLAALSGLLIGLWRVVRGPGRRRAAAWGLVGLIPICGWLALGAYVLQLVGKGESPKNVFTRIASMAAASLMEAQARYAYPYRMESDRLVMLYDDRIEEPRRDLEAMEKHVTRMEAMTGKPLRAKIYWVRGELLGQRRMALYGLALGSSKSPTDWETADHPDRLSADRHELAHAVLHQHQPPDADPPALLVEGWAESLAGPTSEKRAEWARESRKLWREKTTAGPTESYLKDLTGAARYHRYIDGAAYSVGSAFAEFLVRKYGMERFLRLYFVCKPGRFEADVQGYLGVDFDTMERDFWEEVDRLAGSSATGKGE